jgi:glycosyltransferase 2 family protein
VTRPRQRRADRRGLRAALWGACVLIVGASVVLAATNGWSELRSEGLDFRPGWLLVAGIVLVAFQLGAALLWQSLVHRLGSPLALRPAMIVWNASLPARFAPTGLLLPVLRAAMSQPYGVPQRVCFASVVYEGILGTVGFVVVAAGFVVNLPALRDEPARWAIVALPVVALALLHPSVFARGAGWILGRAGREGLPATIPVASLLRYVLIYAVLVVVGGLSLFALVQALHPVDAGDAPVVVGAFAAGSALATIAFVLPGGLGAREAGMVLALAPVMPSAIAIAIAIGFRLLQLAIEVLLALGAAALAGRALVAGAGPAA